jgi:Ca2+-binding EF-hand superfamily protein
VGRDGSGAISYDEFQKWWRTEDRFGKLQLSEDEMAVLTRCTDYFKHFDRDLSGSLSAEEFRSVLVHRTCAHACCVCVLLPLTLTTTSSS